jgi:hypothetical protein
MTCPLSQIKSPEPLSQSGAENTLLLASFSRRHAFAAGLVTRTAALITAGKTFRNYHTNKHNAAVALVKQLDAAPITNTDI